MTGSMSVPEHIPSRPIQTGTTSGIVTDGSSTGSPYVTALETDGVTSKSTLTTANRTR